MTVNHEYTLKNQGVSNTAESILLPRHGWYSYKEGFSPYLVEHALKGIKDFNKEKDIVFDPFNGSGTATLFSSLNGYKAYGYEVNPFSTFISRTKEISLSEKEQSSFCKERDVMVRKSRRGKKSPLLNFSTFSETKGKEKWLFNPEVLNAYEGGFNYVKSIANKKIQNLLKLSIINSAMDNCNAKKDGKCLRYKTSWQDINYSRDTFINSVETNSSTYLHDIQNSEIITRSNIINGDSRVLLSKHNQKFKLCITSPPYLNSFDYTDIYRPELFLGEFIVSQEQLFKLRFKTLRSHVNHEDSFEPGKSFGNSYDNVINGIGKDKSPLWHNRIPSMIQSYFEDMTNVLSSLRSQADENAQLWIIVGNSAYADFEIPTDLILAEIGGKANWYLQEIGVLRYLHKRGSKHSPSVSLLRESVIIFGASPRV